MAGANWSEVVEIAVLRHTARTGAAEFSLQEIKDSELARIVRETGSRGETPDATFRRELQQLRDRGGVEFLGRGNYRLATAPVLLPAAPPSKCVFAVGSPTSDEGEADRFYRFPQRWLNTAARSVGQWILCQEPRHSSNRGYYAAARVEQIVRDPRNENTFLALIEPGTYLEFGRDVPTVRDDRDTGRVRAISDEDFNRVVSLGLIGEEDLLPRADEVENDEPALERVYEKQTPWLGPIERETVLTSRKVRNRQFRKRVLDVYDRRCALTGMQLINGGGRAEAQAAHIMSVEAGGPDTVANGIALSGTVHWMFDRGLIALSDAGDILLSRKINDVESVEKLIHPDRQARFPSNDHLRPHPRFLAWHREYHGLAA